MKKEFFTITELARALGISRVAVFKRIKAKQIKAQKIGRSYVIKKADLPMEFGGELTEEKKQMIAKAVRKTVQEYGEALRLLGKE